jgi:hypothetical protein
MEWAGEGYIGWAWEVYWSAWVLRGLRGKELGLGSNSILSIYKSLLLDVVKYKNLCFSYLS